MEQNNTNGIVAKQGWSWGAFAFNASFLLGVKRYKYLWWFLFAFVPFVSIVFWIVMVIYLGLNGYEIAARGTQFSNQSEYDGYFKAQDNAGKILFFVFLICAVLGIVFALTAFSSILMHPHWMMMR